MRKQLIAAIENNQAAFAQDLSRDIIECFADYYALLMEHNERLHLVAPCPPEEFATRHILESLTLLKHLPQNAKFVDVGSGGGLPGIPCLIARGDLYGRLIESKQKKADFLSLATKQFGLEGRSDVVAAQFAETTPGNAEFATCRALDKFPARLLRLIKWSGECSLLFFGGETIGTQLKELGLEPLTELMPLSERRYLFTAMR